jgi:hypothetical protein
MAAVDTAKDFGLPEEINLDDPMFFDLRGEHASVADRLYEAYAESADHGRGDMHRLAQEEYDLIIDEIEARHADPSRRHPVSTAAELGGAQEDAAFEREAQDGPGPVD